MRGNDIALAGNIYPVSKDDSLEMRFSPGGTAYINFNLSCWSHKEDGADKAQYISYRCVAFGDLAEHIAESLEKGDAVLAFGRMQANNWTTDEGEKRYDQKVIIDELGPTLRWSNAQIERIESSSSSRSRDSRPQARDDYGPDEAPF